MPRGKTPRQRFSKHIVTLLIEKGGKVVPKHIARLSIVVVVFAVLGSQAVAMYADQLLSNSDIEDEARRIVLQHLDEPEFLAFGATTGHMFPVVSNNAYGYVQILTPYTAMLYNMHRKERLNAGLKVPDALPDFLPVEGQLVVLYLIATPSLVKSAALQLEFVLPGKTKSITPIRSRASLPARREGRSDEVVIDAQEVPGNIGCETQCYQTLREFTFAVSDFPFTGGEANYEMTSILSYMEGDNRIMLQEAVIDLAKIK